MARDEAGFGTSSGNPGADPIALRIAAIERLTAILLTAGDDEIPQLVAERRALRAEIEALRRALAGNVVDLRPRGR